MSEDQLCNDGRRHVIGNYRIDHEIGEGGMSHVFVGKTLAATEFLCRRTTRSSSRS